MKISFISSLTCLLLVSKVFGAELDLVFDPEKNHYQLSEPFFEYDVTDDEMRFGDLLISPDSFQVTTREVAGERIAVLKVPRLAWDDFRVGLNVAGTGLAVSFPKQELTTLADLPEELRSQLSLQGHGPEDFVLRNLEALGYLKKKGKDFRFCLSQSTDERIFQYCTPYYFLRDHDGVETLEKAYQRSTMVLSAGKISAKKGELRPQSEKLNFYAVNRAGYSLEMNLRPRAVRLDEAWILPNKKVQLRGHGPNTPFADMKRFSTEAVSSTAGRDQSSSPPETWQAEVEASDGVITIYGEQEVGFFQQRLSLENVPPLAAKISTLSTFPDQTYSNEKKIRLKKSQTARVHSMENSVRDLAGQPTEVLWRARASRSNKVYRPRVFVSLGGKEYVSELAIDRSFARDFSVRFSGVASSAGVNPVGELAYNQWFENFLGIDSSFTNFRWGASLKYFSSLTPIKGVSSNLEPADIHLNSFTADLKYRFTPGLWQKDESWGLLMGVQRIDYGGLVVDMAGGGIFWARSLPEVFDDILKIVPIFDYPKWVDAELIGYPLELDGKYKLRPTYALNFHGKIQWTPKFFGEAGFGAKGFQFEDESDNQAQLSSIYGTVGFGLNF